MKRSFVEERLSLCGLDASTARLGLEAGYCVKQVCTITLHVISKVLGEFSDY